MMGRGFFLLLYHFWAIALVWGRLEFFDETQDTPFEAGGEQSRTI